MEGSVPGLPMTIIFLPVLMSVTLVLAVYLVVEVSLTVSGVLVADCKVRVEEVWAVTEPKVT